MERKTFRLKLNDLDDQGIFTGYAGIFAIEDLQNDIIERGAFKRTLDHSGGSVPILWQHKSEEPIGVGLEAKEDTSGLYVRGQLNLDTQRGKEAYSLLKQGAIKGLSIGYDAVKKEYKDGKRLLKEIKLYEYSVVTFPAQPLANVLDVKEEGKPEGDQGWDETDSSWRYRLKNPDLFSDDSFKSKEITEGITLVMGKLKDEDSMVAQSIVFNKDKFPEKSDAQEWLDGHEELTKSTEIPEEKDFQEMEVKAGRILSSANLTKLKDAIGIIQALLDIAEPKPDPVDDHSGDEEAKEDSADTKSDSETSLDDELQTLLHDMKSYITR